MKFELTSLTDYSDDAVLAELRRVSALVPGPVLTSANFSRLARVSASTLRHRFGDWRKALEAAGLGHRFDASTEAFTREEIVDALRRTAEAVGRPAVTKRDLREHTRISDRPIRRLFGSYRRALQAAGLEQVPGGVRYTDEECYENLLDVWTAHGRQPKISEMKSAPSSVGPKAYILRWGGWRAALAAFVARVNLDLPAAEPAPDPTSDAVRGSAPAVVRRSPRGVSLGLRWAVMKRDRFRCVLCGRSPATHPVTLEVDHILAWSLGGETVVSNLRSLCHDCNLGKGASRGDA